MDTSPEYFHVLVVDDNIINRKLIEKLLHKSSCKVTAVDSGRKALQVLGLSNENSTSDCLNDLKVVDLIITDYSMPGMTGFELLKKIKSSSTHKDVPVIIMSSENIETRIRRCLEEGAREYILKPVKLLDIQRVKNSILQTGGAEQEVVEEKIKLITRFSNESESRGVNLPESAGQCSSKVCESSSGL